MGRLRRLEEKNLKTENLDYFFKLYYPQSHFQQSNDKQMHLHSMNIELVIDL